jgi:hypothetical protein
LAASFLYNARSLSPDLQLATFPHQQLVNAIFHQLDDNPFNSGIYGSSALAQGHPLVDLCCTTLHCLTASSHTLNSMHEYYIGIGQLQILVPSDSDVDMKLNAHGVACTSRAKTAA